MLIVDETRETGGVGEGVLAALVEHGYTGALDRVASQDSFIPLGDAALQVLLSEDTIEAAAVKLAGLNPLLTLGRDDTAREEHGTDSSTR